MNRIFYLSVLLLCSFKEPAKVSVIGKAIPAFSLSNTKGGKTTFATYPAAKGFIIIFTCNHCPFAKLYTARLNALNKKYSAAGMPLLAINSMDTLVYAEERFELMKKKVAAEHYNFPYLSDSRQEVLKLFHASHTPQAFIIWKENNQWFIKYSGAIDDNGQHPEQATSFVAHAADELLAGKPVSKPETLSFGCAIHYR